MIEAIPNNPREKQQNSEKNKRTAPSVYNFWPILNNISTIYVLTPPGAPVKVPVSLELRNNHIQNILVYALIIFRNNWGRYTIYDICNKLNEPSKSIQPIQNYTIQFHFDYARLASCGVPRNSPYYSQNSIWTRCTFLGIITVELFYGICDTPNEPVN